jgi:thiamine biosynthesis lipoprotein
MSREASFPAMGVDVSVRGATRAELGSVKALFSDWELAFSRFRADSELSRVNRAHRVAEVSPLFADVLARALAAAAATGGLVDPTLGRALEAAGYDRDFAALDDGDPRPLEPAAPGRWRELELVGRLLFRPAGVTLDLNGVVKGLAADRALELLAGPGFVAAGGDVAVRGSAVVALPDGETSVRVSEGGIATSGTGKRRWSRGGRAQHHLIDPRTGRPSRSRWLEVTVAAGSCLAADVAAKAAYLLDGDGPAWLEEHGLPGRLVGPAGVVETAGWREALAA